MRHPALPLRFAIHRQEMRGGAAERRARDRYGVARRGTRGTMVGVSDVDRTAHFAAERRETSLAGTGLGTAGRLVRDRFEVDRRGTREATTGLGIAGRVVKDRFEVDRRGTRGAVIGRSVADRLVKDRFAADRRGAVGTRSRRAEQGVRPSKAIVDVDRRRRIAAQENERATGATGPFLHPSSSCLPARKAN